MPHLIAVAVVGSRHQAAAAAAAKGNPQQAGGKLDASMLASSSPAAPGRKAGRLAQSARSISSSACRRPGGIWPPCRSGVAARPAPRAQVRCHRAPAPSCCAGRGCWGWPPTSLPSPSRTVKLKVEPCGPARRRSSPMSPTSRLRSPAPVRCRHTCVIELSAAGNSGTGPGAAGSVRRCRCRAAKRSMTCRSGILDAGRPGPTPCRARELDGIADQVDQDLFNRSGIADQSIKHRCPGR